MAVEQTNWTLWFPFSSVCGVCARCAAIHHPFWDHKLSQRHFDVYFTINNHFSSFFPLCVRIVQLRDSVWESFLSGISISLAVFCCPFSHYSLKMQSKHRFCNVVTCLALPLSSQFCHLLHAQKGKRMRLPQPKVSANETFVNFVRLKFQAEFRITTIFLQISKQLD